VRTVIARVSSRGSRIKLEEDCGCFRNFLLFNRRARTLRDLDDARSAMNNELARIEITVRAFAGQNRERPSIFFSISLGHTAARDIPSRIFSINN